MKKYLFHVTILLFVMMIAAACSPQDDDPPIEDNQGAMTASSDSLQHEVKMINTEGEKIGEALLTETEKGVNLQLQVEGFEPGEKAMHFHEVGKCDTPDFITAGDH